ncbi:DsbA family protein [Deinococcus radiophilus]|uniref:DsbA family protein n=1 Tax=Deinococcus radiophilus TaxID=32062 RepID=UPI001E4C5319|nr:thioredoxin domain-containing protein [Deinococcus radiophilus]UFA52022.1 thioredoxin domain-containing protein [Deinococcus radiophilus]
MNRQNNRALLILTLALAVIAGLLMFNLAKRPKPQSSAAISTEQLIRPDSPFLEPADAKVTIVEFFDPECESCAAVEPALMDVMQKYNGEVRLVARYFPLHSNSTLAAGLIEAAAQDSADKRWRMRDYLFQKQREWGEQQTAQTDKFLDYAEDMGLDRSKAQATMESAAVRDLLARDRKDGEAVGVTGTPTFFVNGKPLPELSLEALENAIQEGLNE